MVEKTLHYKLRFWDYQFKSLISTHVVEGGEFEWEVNDSEGAWVVVNRLDYDRTNDTDFLQYTFKLPLGREVVYKVDNTPYGRTMTNLVKVTSHNGEILLLNDPNPIAEEVMRECYLTGVKIMSTFWFK